MPIKMNGIFTDIEQRMLKFVWNHKKPRTDKNILRKNKAGGTIVLDFKIYYKATLIKQYGTSKNRYTDQ